MIITNNKHPKGSKNKRTNFKKLEPLVHRKKKIVWFLKYNNQLEN